MLTILGVLALPLAAAPPFTLVADGAPRAVLVTGEEPSEQRLAAVALLRDLVRESTGAELPVTAVADDRPAVHVGRSPAVDALGVIPADLDDDGFVLHPVDETTYVIAGPTEWGTEFGVCEFLERHVGVRWLLPGEHGTDVPARRDVVASPDEVRSEPAYFSRLLSGLKGPAQAEWARRNRMHGRVSFHHNLLHLFPPSRYFDTHPEFYPIVNGQRYRPTSDDDHTWQPNFSAPGIVDEAIANITRYFAEHPEQTSYSLGINDGRAYDESPESLARETGTLNTLGIRNVSDSYYQWCNEVIEGVLKVYPDKWFGCLAYSNVFDPPTRVKVHPRLIPYMTYDRMKWIDPEIEAMGHRLTEQWQATSPVLGWYDYAYGSPYCLPRVYPHRMQEYLRFGRDHGVRAHYAEIYPNWGEGPKPYLYLRLQWDPDLDVDAVLDEWYERCVGPDAAPLLKEYYAIWERFWTKDILSSPWFTKGGQYLNFASPTYLAIVNEDDVRRSRVLLDGCLAAARTEPQKARAALLRDAFEYYEASALAYRADVVAREQPLDTPEQALAAVEDSARRVAMAARRSEVFERFRGHPVLDTPLGMDRYGALRGDNWGSGLLWRLLDWVRRDERVRAAVEALRQHDSERVRDQAEALLVIASGERGERLSVNDSFEDGVNGWSLWVKENTGTMRHSTDLAHTGQGSVLCDGMRRGGPNQIIAVRPGRYLAVCYVYVEPGAARGTVTLAPTMRGDNDVNLPSPSTELVPAPGQWVALICPLTVPAAVNDTPVTKVLLVAIVDGFQDGGKVYIDDLAFYRLPD